MAGKLVAVMLLLAFMAVPGFAAIQCFQPSSAHHHCTHCAMMMANSGQPQVAAMNTTAPCCRMVPSAPVPKPVSATQANHRQLAVVRDVLAEVVRPEAPRKQNVALPDRQSQHRSQAVLCTFLI